MPMFRSLTHGIIEKRSAAHFYTSTVRLNNLLDNLETNPGSGNQAFSIRYYFASELVKNFLHFSLGYSYAFVGYRETGGVLGIFTG